MNEFDAIDHCFIYIFKYKFGKVCHFVLNGEVQLCLSKKVVFGDGPVVVSTLWR